MSNKKIYIFILLIIISVSTSSALGDRVNGDEINYRDEMRTFVQEISLYGKSLNNHFLIIPQNGQELLSEKDNPHGFVYREYLAAIDGVGREDLFFGYVDDDRRTPKNAENYMISYLDIAQKYNIKILVTDYCFSPENISTSYILNEKAAYTSYAATKRSLDNLPSSALNPFHVNHNDIKSLGEISNFLYLINPEEFSSRTTMLNELRASNYDLILIDLFDNNGLALDLTEINSLKFKANGGKRLVIAYMSIGEAEDYRFYWDSTWDLYKPEWIHKENPAWKGNFKVKYWNPHWKGIILGSDNSYLDLIINAGFDGVYLDIIDAFESFE